MTNFLKYSTPAERVRGLSFSEIGGVLSGSNNFEYTLEGNEFNSDEISVEMEFYPSFNWDDGLSHFFFDTTSSERYLISKTTANTLLVLLGGISVLTVSGSAYSSYWDTNSRNILTLATKSGDTKLYLNGNLIGSSATAWVTAKPTTLYLGSRYTSAEYFTGEITSAKIYKNILAVEEISDRWNNTTYNYKNEALIHYPMTPATHSGTQTLDVSGNGLHGTLVGAPTQNTNKGYTLNGSTQYVSFTEQTFTGEFSLCMFSRVNGVNSETLFGNSTGDGKIIYFNGDVFSRIISGGSTDQTTLAPGSTINFIGLTRDSDDKVDLYINNTKYRLYGDIAQAGNSSWSNLAYDNLTRYLNGSILEARIYDKFLSPTQMFDMSIERIGMRE